MGKRGDRKVLRKYLDRAIEEKILPQLKEFKKIEIIQEFKLNSTELLSTPSEYLMKALPSHWPKFFKKSKKIINQ
jgi:hypothetical protein